MSGFNFFFPRSKMFLSDFLREIIASWHDEDERVFELFSKLLSLFYNFISTRKKSSFRASFKKSSKRLQIALRNRLKKLGTIVPTLDNSSSSVRKVNGKIHELHSDRQEAAATFLLLSIFLRDFLESYVMRVRTSSCLLPPSMRALLLFVA